MKWSKWSRKWLLAIIVWVWLIGGIALGEHYRWSDAVWFVAWRLFLLVLGVWFVVDLFRNRHKTGGYVGYRGVPRWVVTPFGDEVEPQRKPADKPR
jgi:hypothetical protein